MIFNWYPVIVSCQAVSYNIVGSNCGICPHNTTGTAVTCVGVSTDGSLCIFRVQTIVCTGILGQTSNAVIVTLKGELIFLITKEDYIILSFICSLCLYPNSSRGSICQNNASFFRQWQKPFQCCGFL